MFSRISRLQLPCLPVDKRASGSGDRQAFDLREAFRVGVVFCAMVNTVIWLGCWLAFRRTEVGIVLFLTVLVLPLVAGTCLIFVGRYVVQTSISWQRGDRRFYQKADDGSESCERCSGTFMSMQTTYVLRGESVEHRDKSIEQLGP